MNFMNIQVSSQKVLDGVTEMVGVLLALALFAMLGHCSSGCFLEPNAPKGDVDAAYRAELVACSTGAKSKADAKACRQYVNTRYGLCERSTWPRITPCDE